MKSIAIEDIESFLEYVERLEEVAKAAEAFREVPRRDGAEYYRTRNALNAALAALKARGDDAKGDCDG